MPTPSGSAFHFATAQGPLSTAYGGILPDPVALEPQQVLTTSGFATNTAVSGSLQHLIVEPGDYPSTADERALRRGSIRTK